MAGFCLGWGCEPCPLVRSRRLSSIPMLHPKPMRRWCTPPHRYNWRRQIIEIWDYILESGIQTLEGCTSSVSFTVYHPLLPIVVFAFCIWYKKTSRLENSFNHALLSKHRSSCCTGRRKRRRSNSTMVLSSLRSARMSRRARWTLLANSFAPAVARHSSNCRTAAWDPTLKATTELMRGLARGEWEQDCEVWLPSHNAI
jgi:hypothetical protein